MCHWNYKCQKKTRKWADTMYSTLEIMHIALKIFTLKHAECYCVMERNILNILLNVWVVFSLLIVLVIIIWNVMGIGHCSCENDLVLTCFDSSPEKMSELGQFSSKWDKTTWDNRELHYGCNHIHGLALGLLEAEKSALKLTKIGSFWQSSIDLHYVLPYAMTLSD